jgi:hypothetical protein
MPEPSVEHELARYGTALRERLAATGSVDVTATVPTSPPRGRGPLVAALAALVVVVAIVVVVARDQERGQSPVEPSPLASTTVSTVGDPADEPILGAGPPVPARLLLADVNAPSFTVVDLASGTQRHYPRGEHPLPAGSITGAELTAAGDAIVTRWDVAYVFAGADFSRPPVELRPTVIEAEPGVAVDIWVRATDDGTKAWIVQPGTSHPTLVDLVDVRSGEVEVHAEVDGQFFPQPRGGRLLLTSSGSPTLLMEQDGSTSELGGAFDSAGPDHLVRLTSDDELEVRDLTSGQRRTIEQTSPGQWRSLANLPLLSPFAPLETVSGDGRLLTSIGDEPDENGVPQRSVLVAIDLDDGALTRLGELQGRAPAATWTGDGRILLADRERISLLDPNGSRTTLLEIPADTYLVAISGS